MLQRPAGHVLMFCDPAYYNSRAPHSRLPKDNVGASGKLNMEPLSKPWQCNERHIGVILVENVTDVTVI
jgi:hypothetical protein